MGGRTGNGEGDLIRNDTVGGGVLTQPDHAAVWGLESRECKGGGNHQNEGDQD